MANKHGKYGSRNNKTNQDEQIVGSAAVEETVTQDVVPEEQVVSEEQSTEEVPVNADYVSVETEEVDNMADKETVQDVPEEELTEEELTDEDLADDDLSDEDLAEEEIAEEEQKPDEEQKPMSIGDVIAQQLELAQKKREQALREAKEAEMKAEQIERLQAAASDEKLAGIIDTIADYDKQLAELTTTAHERISPLQEQIDSINMKLAEATKPINENRTMLYNTLVEKVGEVGAKMLVSPAGLSIVHVRRSPSVSGAKGGRRNSVIEAVCDRGLTPAQAADELKLYGNNEKAVGGNQATGTLVQRHLKIAKEKGLCTQDSNGKWVRTI